MLCGCLFNLLIYKQLDEGNVFFPGSKSWLFSSHSSSTALIPRTLVLQLLELILYCRRSDHRSQKAGPGEDRLWNETANRTFSSPCIKSPFGLLQFWWSYLKNWESMYAWCAIFLIGVVAILCELGTHSYFAASIYNLPVSNCRYQSCKIYMLPHSYKIMTMLYWCIK